MASFDRGNQYACIIHFIKISADSLIFLGLQQLYKFR